MLKVNPKRIRIIKDSQLRKGPVVYWMDRDQRMNDNWALLFSQENAIETRSPLLVIFCFSSQYKDMTIRHLGFMFKGLMKLASNLHDKNIPFHLLTGEPDEVIPDFLRSHQAGCLITDFNPLKEKRRLLQTLCEKIEVPFYEVDAHNIVPCWVASQKQEYGAYTLRPKISKLLPEFLEDFPGVKFHPYKIKAKSKNINWQKLLEEFPVDRSVPEVKWIIPGEDEAHKVFKYFIRKKLNNYHKFRNNPTLDGQSGLSPYLHFGQISSQRVALDVIRSNASKVAKDTFLEELIIRNELSDNFCLYNSYYDSFNGFPLWAQKTLQQHLKDRRPYLYSLSQFENGEPHDHLWNAAQMEMVLRGKMHGYTRMYWAKKILEWTPSPQEALEIAIFLNDKYELDGRDPNGYTGIAWSIGGVHDRAWGKRPIFGKIRYMSYQGCKSKFDISKYINQNYASAG